MLLELMLIIGPPAIIYCLYKALKGTRIERDPLPPWLITSIMNINEPDRKWNLK